MLVVQTLVELRAALAARRKDKVAFVPTMGNLHAGHLALVREARQHGSCVVVSIFVNPMQFGANEDLEQYPATLEQDQQALQAEGADILFLPSVKEIYPRPMQQQIRIEVPEISSLYCGASRPGHFVGVATVVCKLFNMVQPDVAVFGKKDFQQLLVIRRMVADLAMPVEIVGVATVRENNGLAMSSRNQYLSAEERQIAPLLYGQLQAMAQVLGRGDIAISALQKSMRNTLDEAGFITDYIEVLNPQTLLPVAADDQSMIILAAAQLGRARLIDNIEVTPPLQPDVGSERLV